MKQERSKCLLLGCSKNMYLSFSAGDKLKNWQVFQQTFSPSYFVRPLEYVVGIGEKQSNGLLKTN
jgi:hypothetical protein